jgi:WD40 repeat protein
VRVRLRRSIACVILVLVVTLIVGLSFQAIHAQNNSAQILSVRWSTDGKILAIGYSSGKIQLINTAERTQSEITTIEVPILAVFWDKSDLTQLGVATNVTVDEFNISTLKNIRFMQPYANQVLSGDWSSDGQLMASVNGDVIGNDKLKDDYNITIWNAKTGEALRDLTLHIDQINQVAFSPLADSHILASAANDSSVVIWNADTGDILSILDNPGGVASLAWNSLGTEIAAVSAPKVRIWDVKAGENIRNIAAEEFIINGIAWSADGSYLAFVDGKNVRIVDAQTGKTLKRLPVESFPYQLAWSIDGRLAYGEADKLVITEPLFQTFVTPSSTSTLTTH